MDKILQFAADLGASVSLARLLSNGPAVPLYPLRNAAYDALAPRARRLLVSQMLAGSVHRVLVVAGRVVSTLRMDGQGGSHVMPDVPHAGWGGIAQSIGQALLDPQVFKFVIRGADLAMAPQTQTGWMVQKAELEPALIRHIAPSSGQGRDVALEILNTQPQLRQGAGDLHQ